MRHLIALWHLVITFIDTTKDICIIYKLIPGETNLKAATSIQNKIQERRLIKN